MSVNHFASLRPNEPIKILVIRSLGGIGDILMTTPCVRQIKEDFPKSHITYATDRHSTKGDDYYELLKNVPFIDEIIDARRIEKSLYDVWVDITSVCIKYENGNQPPLNRIDIFARACGINRLRNPVPFYKVEQEERILPRATYLPYKQMGRKLVFLHTASFDAKRCWPVERYVQLIELAEKRYPEIQFLVSDFNHVLPDIRHYSNCCNVTNPSIRKLAAIIELSDFFIGPDSGPMHIAGTLGVPSLVLFGSVPAEARINYYSKTRAITTPHFVCGGPCFYAKCNFNTRCMLDITADRVLSVLKERL
jgi:ADP-heptose:LPS heptosyltransferase